MEEAFIAITSAISSSSSSYSSLPSSPMDTRIWRKLPPPLVDRILAFLPPPAFFRFRSVCKRFYSLLFSDTFLNSHLRLSPRRSWLVFFLLPPKSNLYPTSSSSSSSSASPPPDAFLFDPESSTWHRFSFDAIVPRGFSPAASSGGLICWLSDEPGTKILLLSNPITQLVAQLPTSPRPRLFPSVGLTAGNSSFSVVVAGDDLISPFAVKNLTAESFHADGITGFYSPWAIISPLPRLCNLDPGRLIAAGGRLYCMSTGPFAVLAYDVGGNAWYKIQAPMRRFLRSPSLAACGDGRVVLVAAVEKSKLSVPRSVRLWGLQTDGVTWAEVERMPPEVYVQFEEAEGGGGFECVGSGELIAITTKQSRDVLLFDFYSKAWRWAPQCPFLHRVGGDGVLRGFGYEPRLATPALGLLDSSSLAFQSFGG
uniref:Unusual floral organs protein n=1 Tax=Lilium formosanum x Lilium longiflorum TaxID=375287 RepID=A0A2Z5XCU6_9LILI|nr:unusual floral organs protein [Lilium formosanum x Lilium longiflorum]